MIMKVKCVRRREEEEDLEVDVTRKAIERRKVVTKVLPAPVTSTQESVHQDARMVLMIWMTKMSRKKYRV